MSLLSVFADNLIGREGVVELCESLTFNFSLTSLDLSCKDGMERRMCEPMVSSVH